MHRSEFVTPKCCDKPSIATMDYKYPLFEQVQTWKVNRMCLKCNTHWFGTEDNVKQYTGREWDGLMDASLNDL